MFECETVSIQCVFKDRKGDLSTDMNIQQYHTEASYHKAMLHIIDMLIFNKAKCKVLIVGNPKHTYRLDVEWIETSPEEKT